MFAKVVLFISLVAATNQASQAFPDIQTGKITPVTSFSGNQTSSSYAYSIPVTVPGTVGVGKNTQAGIALISYNSLVSLSFAFNSTITALSNTSISVNIQTFQTTYFMVLSFHYIIHAHSTLNIKNLCYYTNSLLSGTGSRSQTFNNATTNLTGAYLTQATMFTGMVMNNTMGEYFSVKVYSSILGNISTAGNKTISTTVQTDQKNIVEWVCVCIVVFNAKNTVQGEFYFKDSTIISYDLGVSNVQPYDSSFLIPNTMLFGLSQLILSLNTVSTQQFILNTDVVTDPISTATFNANLQSLVLQQLFIWYDTCILTALNIVPTSGYTCISYTVMVGYTLGCQTGEYADTTNLYCLSCAFQGGHCKTCDNTQCTSCEANSPEFRSLNNTNTPHNCTCMTGYYDQNDVCLPCSNLQIHCDTCNATYCSHCTSGFTASAGKCYCLPGTFMTNGSCALMMGCLSIGFLTSGMYCQQCDTASNYQQLTNFTCTCVAHTAFDSYTGKCLGICNDGVAFAEPCDLGYTLNYAGGHGCANCTVEPGWYCSAPNTSSASICVTMKTYSGQYLYTIKELSANTADIYIQLPANDPYLAQMNFSSLVQTSIPTSAIVGSYDSATGVLMIQATYTQSIESSTQLLNISFDPTKIYSPNVVINTQLNGVNAQLKFNTFQSYNSIIGYIALFAGGLALMFGVFSGAIGFKLIGWEICMPVQVVFLSFILQNEPLSALSSLVGLNLSTGYNQIQTFNTITSMGLDKGLMIMQRYYQFLCNCNFTYGYLILLLIVTLVCRIGVKQKIVQPAKSTNDKSKKKKKKEDIEKQIVQVITPPQQPSGLQKAYYFLLDRLLVTVWMLLLLNAIFSFGIQIQQQDPSANLFSTNLNIAASLLILILELGGLVFIAIKIRERDHSITYHCQSAYYPIFYIVSQVFTILVIFCTYYATQYAIIAVLFTQLFPIPIYIYLAPYGTMRSFNSIVGFFCQLLPPISTTMIMLNQYIDYQLLPTVSAFVILGLTIIAEGLSIARLVLRYKQIKNKEMQKLKEKQASKVQAEASHLQALAYSSIKNQALNGAAMNMLNWQKNEDKQKQYRKLSSQDDSDEENEGEVEDELRKIKTRLKKQIVEKRNYEL